MHDMTDQSLVTVAAAARILGKSRRSVSRYAQLGMIPVVTKLPGPLGSYLFDAAELDRIAAAGTVAEHDEAHA